MRTGALLFFLTVFGAQALASEKIDAGIFAGTSYYFGNINPGRQFYNISPAGGLLVKYNFNEHYSLRTNFNFGRIMADDLDFPHILNQTRNAYFVNNFYDFSLQGEFNFQPFRATMFSRPLSPYVTAGLAYTFVTGSTDESSSGFNIPFGVGLKYGLNRRITLGMEWILKKNFNDNIDGVKSFGQYGSPSWVHNNDWVSLAGFFMTIRPFDRRGDCPVYR
jgi:hypothetical protein